MRRSSQPGSAPAQPDRGTTRPSGGRGLLGNGGIVRAVSRLGAVGVFLSSALAAALLVHPAPVPDRQITLTTYRPTSPPLPQPPQPPQPPHRTAPPEPE